MKYVGAHVSTGRGVQEAPLNAGAIGARAFALFTRNPSRWSSPAIKPEQAEAFAENCKRFGYTADYILPHDSFLINLGTPDEQKRAMSLKAFLDEFARCEQLGLTMLNFHPGAHLNLISDDESLQKIAAGINYALERSSGVKAVIENTAGQGSNLGWQFAHIARIIELVEDKSRVGVCIDTCHTLAAGYDLTTEEGYARTWEEFDRLIGRDYLSGIHLNDSLRPCGSRIDRHAPLRQGCLTEEFFRRFMNDPRFDNMPIILETTDESLWPEEIAWMYSLEKEPIVD